MNQEERFRLAESKGFEPLSLSAARLVDGCNRPLCQLSTFPISTGWRRLLIAGCVSLVDLNHLSTSMFTRSVNSSFMRLLLTCLPPIVAYAAHVRLSRRGATSHSFQTNFHISVAYRRTSAKLAHTCRRLGTHASPSFYKEYGCLFQILQGNYRAKDFHPCIGFTPPIKYKQTAGDEPAGLSLI